MDWQTDTKKFCNELGVSLEACETKIKEVGKIGHKYFSEGYLPMLYFTIAYLALENVERILEIGTGYGEMAAFLSKLIPSATIHTIDAPSGDIDYEKWAWRRNKKYMEMFKQNIKISNIVYIEKNSLFLPSTGLPETFELIWVDGCHEFPVVGWDTMFAYNRLKEDGFIFMHDYAEGNDVSMTFKHVSEIVADAVGLLPSQKRNVAHKVAWIRKQRRSNK